VLPQPPEKLAALLFLDPARALQDLANRALAVDRLDDPLLRVVDEKREVRIGVAWIDEHRGDAGRRSVLDRECPRQSNGNEAAPDIAFECDWLGLAFAIVAVGDEAVPVHGSSQEFDRGMLGGRGKRGKASAMRRFLDRAALRKVGRLLVPAAKFEAASLEPIVKLRHGIGAVLGVQQRIGERVWPCEVLRPFQDASDRMVNWQRLYRLAEIAQVFVPDADPKQPAIILHHGNAGAPVRRIDHDVHRAIARKAIAQRAKAYVWVAQMVKYARADDLVERLAKLADALDREPVELQVLYVMLALKITRVAQACFAEVDRRHARFGLHKRISSGLRRSASSDKDRAIWTRLLQRPQQQRLRAPPLRIPVVIETSLQAGDGRRIGVRLVERANRLGAIGGRFRVVSHC
jgi:hypothetical protein